MEVEQHSTTQEEQSLVFGLNAIGFTHSMACRLPVFFALRARERPLSN